MKEFLFQIWGSEDEYWSKVKLMSENNKQYIHYSCHDIWNIELVLLWSIYYLWLLLCKVVRAYSGSGDLC